MNSCDLLRLACPRSFLLPFLDRKVRPDGRGFAEARPLRVTGGASDAPLSRNPSSGFPSSALASSGRDTWIAAVECRLGAPVKLLSLNNEERLGGLVSVSAEIPRACVSGLSDPIGAGRELSAFLSSVFNNEEVIDRTQLLFEDPRPNASCADREAEEESDFSDAVGELNRREGETNLTKGFAWHLSVRVVCLCFDGSLRDVPLLAVAAALKGLRLPSVEWCEDRQWWSFVKPISSTQPQTQTGSALLEAVSQKDRWIVPSRPLRMKSVPVCVTACFVLDSTWIVDPTKEEMELGDQLTLLRFGSEGAWQTHKLQGFPVDKLLLNQIQLAVAQLAAERLALLEQIEFPSF